MGRPISVTLDKWIDKIIFRSSRAAVRPRNLGSIPRKDKRFFSSGKNPTRLLGANQPHSQWVSAASVAGMRLTEAKTLRASLNKQQTRTGSVRDT